MIKISLSKRFSSAEAIGYTPNYLLVKSVDSLTVFSEADFLPYHKVVSLSYGQRVLTSPNGKFAFVLSTLFSNSLIVYYVPSLRIADTYCYKGAGIFDIKDACFSLDSQYLFILADVVTDKGSQTLLIRKKLLSDEKPFSMVLDTAFDYLSFVKEVNCLALFAKSGKIGFFQGNEVIQEVSLNPFHKAYFIEKGHLLVTDTTLGFNLLSHNGKVIQQCDFLVPVPLVPKTITEDESESFKIKESYYDLLASNEANLIFYVTRILPNDVYSLYIFSSEDFSLLKRIKFKPKIYSLDYRNPYLFIKTSIGVYVFRIKNLKKDG